MSGQTEHLFVEALAIGTPVEVRNRFNGGWSGGFEVDGMSGGGYWLLRRSDRTLLPAVFLSDDVRPATRPLSDIDVRAGETSRWLPTRERGDQATESSSTLS
jgi:hypothetical protein